MIIIAVILSIILISRTIDLVIGEPLTIIQNEISHLNYYYVLIDLGTLSEPIPLLIDTSSSHTYINPDNELLKSSTFEWLTCMDAENCNVCLPNRQQCAWEFACEQMYIMAKDIIHNISDASSQEDIYLVFGYNVRPQTSSHQFSMEKQNNDLIMGGVLSLNRQSTSFSQQLYAQHDMTRQFAHYFNRDEGKLAFGDDVEILKEQLDIMESEISWIAYLDEEEEEASMYQVYLEGITLDNGGANEVIFSENGLLFSNEENLNILTFDTGITGISMNYYFKDMVLNYITNTSNLTLASNSLYPYCINETHYESIYGDLYFMENITDNLPEIQIRISSNMIYIISPQQYLIQITNRTIEHPLCLDISFDWDDGICLGSLPMENYLIIYNDDIQSVGIVDKNINHHRQQIQQQLTVRGSAKFVFMLSIILGVLLVCCVFTSIICVVILKKSGDRKRKQALNEDDDGGVSTKWNYRRRKSVTLDGDISPPQQVVINARDKEKEIQLNAVKSGNNSMSSSLSPLQYYDGNIKSIVYDRIIQPWTLEDNMDAI